MSHGISRPLPLAESPQVFSVYTRRSRTNSSRHGPSFAITRARRASTSASRISKANWCCLPGEYAAPRGCSSSAVVDLPASTQVRAGRKVFDPAFQRIDRPCGRLLRPAAARPGRLSECRRDEAAVRSSRRSDGSVWDGSWPRPPGCGARAGYACVLLDTLDDMEVGARAVRELGFGKCRPTTTTRSQDRTTSRRSFKRNGRRACTAPTPDRDFSLGLRQQGSCVADLELARRFDIERSHLAVLDQHRITVAAHAHAATVQVERQTGGLGEARCRRPACAPCRRFSGRAPRRPSRTHR